MIAPNAKNFVLKKSDTPGFNITDPELFNVPSDILHNVKEYDPHCIIASLLYLSRLARPDISHSVSFLTRQVHSWSQGADAALKKLVGYLSATSTFRIKQPLPHKKIKNVTKRCSIFLMQT